MRHYLYVCIYQRNLLAYPGVGLALSTDVTNVVYGLVVVWNGSMIINKVVSLCKYTIHIYNHFLWVQVYIQWIYFST